MVQQATKWRPHCWHNDHEETWNSLGVKALSMSSWPYPCLRNRCDVMIGEALREMSLAWSQVSSISVQRAWRDTTWKVACPILKFTYTECLTQYLQKSAKNSLPIVQFRSDEEKDRTNNHLKQNHLTTIRVLWKCNTIEYEFHNRNCEILHLLRNYLN